MSCTTPGTKRGFINPEDVSCFYYLSPSHTLLLLTAALFPQGSFFLEPPAQSRLAGKYLTIFATQSTCLRV